ncbi:MAG: NADH-quinone oxidoreductase subunit N [Anaerolineales bacterium]|uniref:NADH-quinone oxidoreductase subunit N n=1 Tax=Candidatus Villigracilis affinis TaxID=3140682 RepID=UPI001D61E4E3|nr:NADH-quinone oxidoreductase subunit N [Anaerolineales bacterium]MBK9602274.1 NADH-quinone oxidoreductase subunit N [Anaerolineales bacterium]MBL0345212.1 NADH-quinone oxidoreductase subunit N [Anaerolineales bacterium]
MFTSTVFASILPEILILVLGIILLIVEPFWKTEQRRNVGWLTAGGLFVAMIVSLLIGQPGEPTAVLGGMIRFDWLGFFFKMLFMFAGAATALLLMDHDKAGQRGEAYLMLLASIIGMNLMAVSADLVMLYLAIETASIPLYILSGFLLSDDRSTEAGFKYLLFGTLASTVLLYGFSLIFGFSGTTNIYKLSEMLAAGQLPLYVSFGLIGLLVVGLGFKIAAVPVHFWAPDVYQGAPTPVAGFLSTASKAAGFAVIIRLFFVALPDIASSWTTILAVLAAVTMTAGNLLAISQTNIKRLLAYSSIGHAGYALIGVVAFSQLGAASVVFYLAAYIATNLLAFGLVMAFSRVTGLEDITDYAGLSRRNPLMGLMMLAAFLSLAGMPPFGGFVAKVFVFAAGVQANYTWLVVVGILNSIIGVYYYLNVLKYVYLYRMPNEDEENHPIPLTRPYTIALVVLVVGVILVGTVFAPWFSWSDAAALNLF